jgi:hypothetical protein
MVIRQLSTQGPWVDCTGLQKKVPETIDSRVSACPERPILYATLEMGNQKQSLRRELQCMCIQVYAVLQSTRLVNGDG